MYAVIPVLVLVKLNIQVNPRFYKREVTSYYLIAGNNLCPGVYTCYVMICTGGRNIHSPKYIPCHERLFTGGEAPHKKR